MSVSGAARRVMLSVSWSWMAWDVVAESVSTTVFSSHAWESVAGHGPKWGPGLSPLDYLR